MKRVLKLVFGNLIKNSCDAFSDTKFNQKNAREIGICVNSDLAKNKIEIEFFDNGCGIDQKETHAIFSPFYTTKASGTGLGLSHSKQIVDAHGGEIHFRSSLGS